MSKRTLSLACLISLATGVTAQTSALDFTRVSLAPLTRTSVSVPAQGNEAMLRNVRFLVSSRTWGDDDLDAVFGTGVSFGFEYDARTEETGLGYEGALIFSFDDEGVPGASIDLTFVEVMLGGRYTYRIPDTDIYAYGGGGLDLALGTLEFDLGLLTGDDTEFGVGGYLHLGAYYEVQGQWSVGVDVRQTLATELEDLPVDYLQFGVVVAYGL